MKNHIAANSGNQEWYTPHEIIEAARRTMGHIHLDPASCQFAQRWIKADRFFTKEENGLTQDWIGNIWLNPPYSNGLIDKFVGRLLQKAKSYEVRQAVVLTNNGTETKWGQSLLCATAAVCFPSSRIKFIDQHGLAAETPLQGQMICGLGVDAARFRYHFEQFGCVWQR